MVWRARDTTTTFLNFGAIPAGKIIRSRGYFLIAHKNFEGSMTPDFKYSAMAMAGDANTVAITRTSLSPTNDDAQVVDMVGWGSVRVSEGDTDAPKQSTDSQSIERKALETSTAATMAPGGIDAQMGNGQDTDNNGNDFILRANRDPQNSQSPVEPPAL